MGRILFIADTHFGDNNIIRYENRPFVNAQAMDYYIIRDWNNNVHQDDIVYVVGDFGADGYEEKVLSELNGHKYLIKGNHDIKSNEYYRNVGFKEVYDHPIILDNFWIVSHEPMYMNRNMPYANIFGHVHGSQLYKDYSAQHYCVSYERIKTPIDFKTIKETVINMNK